MVTLDRFERLTARAVRRIPRQFRLGVAGFYVEPRACRHRTALPGIYVLGHYHRRAYLEGPTVTLYYGSFRKVFRGAPEPVIRREIARTIAHELLHHWEIQSGYDDLGDDDRKKLQQWAQRLGYHGGEAVGHDLIEALLFLFLVFLGIAVASRMLE
ncbi:MAG: hypothetical protein GX442_10675 [Candidatus Riflebacteria bacterium]|nr:hypothetical protein [Candidatus Riflebacteria bacterium]